MQHTNYEPFKVAPDESASVLNSAQIEQAQAFIRSRGFTHIEVEMEILDHVACAVEQLLAKDPEMPLDEAIQKVHASFGVMGFSVFEDEVKASLGKRIMRMYRNYLWQCWTSLTSFKMIASAALIFTLLTFWFNTLDADLFKIAAYATLALTGSIPVIQQYRTFRKWSKKSLMLGQLLWPFLFTAFGAAYLLQVLPESYLEGDRMTINVIFVILSLLVATTTWAALLLTKEVYAYTHKHWLKYAL